MLKTKIRMLLVALGLLGSATLLGGCEQKLSGASLEPWYVSPAWTATPEAERRVGTVRRDDLLIAYYRSAHFNAWLDDLRAQRDAARTAGEEARARAIESRGQAAQDVAHDQLARRAPLTNILEVIGPDLPAIAADAEVHAIYEAAAYPGPGTQVDVTEPVLDLLPPRPEKKEASPAGASP